MLARLKLRRQAAENELTVQKTKIHQRHAALLDEYRQSLKHELDMFVLELRTSAARQEQSSARDSEECFCNSA